MQPYSITLPFTITQEVIAKIKENNNKVIALIQTHFVNNILTTTIHVQSLN
jgi:hypothetical protein